jgi:hypothetical protein
MAFDYSAVDIGNIKSDTLDIGLHGQDCALIAQTFERGAHNTPTEAAVFATLSRTLQNHSKFAATITNSLQSYIQVPQQAVDAASDQSKAFANQANTGQPADNTSPAIQALDIGTQQQATYGSDFGKNMLDAVKKCIPCTLRPLSLMELFPNPNLLNIFENYLKNLLKTLGDIIDMLKNIGAYTDLCKLLDLLAFMCPQDLQRVIALLMSMFMLEGIKMGTAMGFLQSLIGPLFAPILLAITALLDKFVKMVTDPIKCMIDVINSTLMLRGVAISPYSATGNPQATGINSSIAILEAQLREAYMQIHNKLDFYTSQAKALLGQLGGGDTAYLAAKLRSLQLVRMISFVVAVITAMEKGRLSCGQGENPSTSQIDAFMSNFVNPNSPFSIWIDDSGTMHLDEKDPASIKPLSDIVNVLQFEGQPIVNANASTIQTASANLAEPIRVVMPCKLKPTSGNAEQLDAWVAELNNL